MASVFWFDSSISLLFCVFFFLCLVIYFIPFIGRVTDSIFLFIVRQLIVFVFSLLLFFSRSLVVLCFVFFSLCVFEWIERVCCCCFEFISFHVDKFVWSFLHFLDHPPNRNCVWILCIYLDCIHSNCISMLQFQVVFMFNRLQIDKHLCITFYFTHLAWCDFCSTAGFMKYSPAKRNVFNSSFSYICFRK